MSVSLSDTNTDTKTYIFSEVSVLQNLLVTNTIHVLSYDKIIQFIYQENGSMSKRLMKLVKENYSPLEI